MHTALLPCAACARHVRAHEPQCPFCGTFRDRSDTPSVGEGPTRLSRAALLLGASLGLVGCPAPTTPTAPTTPSNAVDAGGAAAPTPPPRTNPNAVAQPPQDPGSMAEVYGAPPPRDPAPNPAVTRDAGLNSMGTRYGAPPPPHDDL